MMTSTLFNRRKLMTSCTALLSALGAGTLLATSTQAKNRDTGVRKLDPDGKLADGKQMITALITHNGLLYIAGQGANSNGPVGKDDIDSHTTKVMENVKQLVETGGGTMDSILQLTVYLASLEYYEPMNKIFKTYFPHGGPARTTVAVAALPGNSMLEINCIAAIVRK
ncbi:MAG TPA: RidA family protein [Terriglobales bacterium]|jgi:enamine deaminase RidA (YjgF/YER057c/UK114 family)|nr:RidA family protein [Terriglobales bacterium]